MRGELPPSWLRVRRRELVNAQVSASAPELCGYTFIAAVVRRFSISLETNLAFGRFPRARIAARRLSRRPLCWRHSGKGGAVPAGVLDRIRAFQPLGVHRSGTRSFRRNA